MCKWSHIDEEVMKYDIAMKKGNYYLTEAKRIGDRLFK